MLLYFFCILTVAPTITRQCAPHTVSKPWTQTSNVQHHHHHQTVENYYLDNRTIYNKLIQIEQRIERIEKRENINSPVPENPKLPETPEKPEKSIKKQEPPTEKEENPENSGKDCLSCPSKPPISENCDDCLSVTVSPPFEYYSCKAIEVQCGDGAKRLKISEKFSKNIIENKFMMECRKGSWILMANHKENIVESISCLKN
ncbi:Protein CBG12275 [Caenorhabditis briggsae]|uniref:C6 domain-containing protein n=2 Tax=Caenorhabditis briggsae TaxID=6238 RepID=A0AAE9DGA5_CAEBR|nr:Protein CBG12275 [Caenorhabditis briggsae]ULU02906.1 hypothetical protein L3Y34_002471 [Caenorhabditis briggsae]CAP31278.1 Protein CBG12275 [Caenorhabditis briggsae]